MANLKPWYRVEGCQPREDLRTNKPLNEADFAVNLDHIRRGESHQDYVKPHLFFARTFMTKSLRELAAGTISILTPIGAALIGLSPGQSIAWTARDGRQHRLTVLSVAPPAASADAETEALSEH